MDKVKLHNKDCLVAMESIPDNSVDMVCCDPPYGTTQCKWDSVIPLDKMWEQLKRVVKPYGAIVMTAGQPFTTTLIHSNMGMFKYCWVWEKSKPSGVAHAKNKPLNTHEDIVVFSDGVVLHKGQSEKRMNYFPQGLERINKTRKNHKHDHVKAGGIAQRPSHNDEYVQEFTNYPKSVIRFQSESRPQHPTQKPVALMEYLIVTYTEQDETILDFTMGSGTTGVAAANTGRKFIGIELDKNYFEIAQKRINNAYGKADIINF